MASEPGRKKGRSSKSKKRSKQDFVSVPDPTTQLSKRSRRLMEEAGWKRGDVAQIRAGKKTWKVVVVSHSDFPGYVLVKWPGTRHVSKAKLEWLERPRLGKAKRV